MNVSIKNLYTGIQYKLGSSPYKNIVENVLVYNNIRGKLDTQIEDESIRLGGIGFLSLATERASSENSNDKIQNVLKNNKNIWHNNYEKTPYIALRMKNGKENEVFMVRVIDRLECPGCAGRYKDVEVRVASSPSYENAVTCGTKSGDGITEFVYK